jgi:hypothetical protein
MPKHRRHITILLIAAALLAAAGFAGYVVYGKLTHNMAASCANCRSFMCALLDDYAANHEGRYPIGGTNALDSLSRCVNQVGDVRYFTSHAQADRLKAYWSKHKTFAADMSCYRYIEGVRTNDPEGLVLLYYWQPTRWECNNHKQPGVGRPVCSLTSSGELRVSFGSWRFMAESEFQEQLARTLAYLRDHNRSLSLQRGHNPADPVDGGLPSVPNLERPRSAATDPHR